MTSNGHSLNLCPCVCDQQLDLSFESRVNRPSSSNGQTLIIESWNISRSSSSPSSPHPSPPLLPPPSPHSHPPLPPLLPPSPPPYSSSPLPPTPPPQPLPPPPFSSSPPPSPPPPHSPHPPPPLLPPPSHSHPPLPPPPPPLLPPSPPPYSSSSPPLPPTPPQPLPPPPFSSSSSPPPFLPPSPPLSPPPPLLLTASHRYRSTVKRREVMVKIVSVILVMMVIMVWQTADNDNDVDDDGKLSTTEEDEKRKEEEEEEDIKKQGDPGFSLLFRSNREEMIDVPIHFDPSLPSWLAGTLIRNGLGLFENGDRQFLHSFDGLAKLSSWRFPGNGSAFFSTRFLTSDFYTSSMSGSTISPYLMLEQPQPPFCFLDRLRALLRGLDNMNVNVYKVRNSENGGHDYLALSDYWKEYAFHPRNLTTRFPVTGRLYRSVAESLGISSFVRMLSSAHPLPEPGTGHHLTFLTSLSLLPFGGHLMQLVRVRSAEEREVVSSWRVDRIPYMHSFSVTQTHALLLAHPFYLNVVCMLYHVTPFRCLDWRGQEPAMLYVVELQTGKMTQLTMSNVFTMHHVNAFNLGSSRIIMDLSTYPDPSFVGSLQLPILHDPNARNGFPAHANLQRYEVNLLVGSVTRVELTPPDPAFINFLDMPTLNEHHRSRPYCYVYGLVCKTDNITLSRVAIVKRDLCGGGRDRSWNLPHHYPVEPLFVPQPRSAGMASEDEGVVLVPIVDGPSAKSYLAVLDARDLSLLTTAVLPTLVPYSLHGRFFPEIL